MTSFALSHDLTAVSTFNRSEPVTLDELKHALRMPCDYNEQNAELAGLLQTAREVLEDSTHRTYMTQQYLYRIDEFPCGDAIELRRPPLQSVDSVTYVDTSGATQTLSTGVYEVDTNRTPGLVRLRYNQSWPGTRDQQAAVSITYTAGYSATPSDRSRVPSKAKQAIKAHVVDNYEGCEMSMQYKTLRDSLRWGDRY